MKLPIYMDYHATTPVDPRVVEVMLPYFTEKFGNPASRQHQFGWIAAEAVETSRAAIAKYLGVEAREIIFTSGATESNNLALKGIAEAWHQKGSHIITVSTEHKSVLDPCRRLEKSGFQVTYLPVDEYGTIDLNRLSDSITSKTLLVSIMTGNNEIGTIQDLPSIGKLCRDKGVFFHTDATQAVGKIPVDIFDTNIDLMSFSGHKMYGPKGIGVLFVRNSKPKIKLTMQMDGGGHERGIRSGTLNVPAIVGSAKALELSILSMNEEANRLRYLRHKMYDAFTNSLEDVFLNGHPTNRLPNNLNISFIHVEDNALMMSLKDIAVSTGSACSTADPEPSHVLKALGVSNDRLHSAIRFGLGRFTTEAEVEYTIDRVIENVNKLRNISRPFRRSSNKVMQN
ncbi:MAG: IscS subfamily cysteine desulfurase [Ignavibacteriales bacterium]|nr:IscS subfamily cysteine desulfurase [Ignavibacteriales bacterium]